ncbi:hypothetical protein PABG_05692 [Paracoccidioides brasiliensis Pb03]|uniref:Uncharacterized protein n=1 Tax=Paracoccidioides brasiliensis TaxID=121759 RepID=A0A1D2J325_PARBR|nr:hypothetical protein PABG_05692 [Paracoccidioides brasiliensis Pb03]ODH12698.1 hypothetical protein ACO22_08005 [Paracoccidioides brasiliensis]ODH47757.1 hypothetical protein GX48_06179 [Paracoccidioides brasiliensis]
MSTPTLIDLPPPPSEPVTPSDMGPSTPNSGTTSLSALSTTAIKDGHQGHCHRSHHAHRSSNASESSTTTLDAERADRISRLAGLERVATSRPSGGGPSSSANPQGMPGGFSYQPPGYFDHLQPLFKERSTVGSASATGSIGGRTTWASSSDIFESDRPGDDDGVSSIAGLSDEGSSSLVGFGEGANSTVSGPVSTPVVRIPVTSGRGASGGSGNSPVLTNRPLPSHTSSSLHVSTGADGASGDASLPSAETRTPDQLVASPDLNTQARMVDGATYDANIVDTAARPLEPLGPDDDNN